jgi:hypothetical protein
MLHPVLLEYGDWMAIAGRLPRAQLPLFQILMLRLFKAWQEGTDTRSPFDAEQLIQDEWRLFEAIAILIPTFKGLPFDLAQIKARSDATELLTWLFLMVVDGDDIKPAKLAEINMDEAIEVDPIDPEDEEAVLHSKIPFPTSGDSEADVLGNLFSAFGSLEYAKLAYEWLDSVTVHRMIKVANELSRPMDDRAKDYLLRCFETALENDPSLEQLISFPPSLQQQQVQQP